MKIRLGMPLEELIVMIFKFVTAYRETMKPEVRDRWDAMLIEDVELLRSRMKAAGQWVVGLADGEDEPKGGKPGGS